MLNCAAEATEKRAEATVTKDVKSILKFSGKIELGNERVSNGA